MPIKRIGLGVTGNYLVDADNGGYILVDTGEPNRFKRFKKIINEAKIDPRSIRLLVITHAHYDHVGNLAAIKQWCQCPVLIHPYEEEILNKGRVVIPPGTRTVGRIMSTGGQILKPIMRFVPTKGDILISENYDLSTYGIDGEIVPTPGHTRGSLSLVLKSGEALVGDLAMNFLGKNTFPIFGDDQQSLINSRELIKSMGVKMIYPAHGKRFTIQQLYNK